MTVEGNKLLEKINQASESVFGINFIQELENLKKTLYLLKIVSREKRYADMIGNIPATDLRTLNRNFVDSDAGFKLEIPVQIMVLTNDASVFLMNKDHIPKNDHEIRPLIVHELCHFIEQTKLYGRFSFTTVDCANGTSIRKAFDEGNRKLHTIEWCNLLAWSARKSAQDSLFGHSNITKFLEAAIPAYDRPSWSSQIILNK